MLCEADLPIISSGNYKIVNTQVGASLVRLLHTCGRFPTLQRTVRTWVFVFDREARAAWTVLIFSSIATTCVG